MALAVGCHGLVHRYGAVQALQGVDVSVEAGEIFGVVGPDGAGKTTLLRILATVMPPTAGGGTVLGRDLVTGGERAKGDLGYLPQRFALYPDLSVRENLEFFADLFGTPRAERGAKVARFLEATALAEFSDRRAEHLSGGMKQKLALACALIHTPRLLILDEPTTGVDAMTRREFWRMLYQLNLQGMTIVMATPYMDEAERCHRVMFLDRGRVMACDRPAALLEHLQGRTVQVICRPLPVGVERLRARYGHSAVTVFGETIHVRVEAAAGAAEEVERALAGACEGVSVTPVDPTLEDVYVEFIQQAGAFAQ